MATQMALANDTPLPNANPPAFGRQFE